jgi:ParB/RepB/Spo0J family partition protein
MSTQIRNKQSHSTQAYSAQSEPLANAQLVPRSEITPARYQPRADMNPKVQEYAKSMKRLKKNGGGIDGTGMIQAMLLRHITNEDRAQGIGKNGEKYVIVAGESRYWASEVAGLDRVPAIITTRTSEEAYEEAGLENIHRNDLSPLDEARFFRYMMNKYSLSMRGLATFLYDDANKIGYIQNRLDGLGAGEDLQELIDERPETLSAARRIETVKDPEMRKYLIEMVRNKSTFKEIEETIRAFKAGVPLSRYRATKEVDEYERKNAREAKGPGSGRSNGKAVLPRFNLEEALDTMIQRVDDTLDTMKPATLAPATRRKLLAKAVQLRKKAEEMEQYLSSQVRGEKGSVL